MELNNSSEQKILDLENLIILLQNLIKAFEISSKNHGINELKLKDELNEKGNLK